MNMKEFKGTKGPWKTTEISLRNSIYIESKDECIGTVWRSEVSDANAKLIVAAPELLRALELIMSISNDHAVIRIAHKAIDKAL